MQGIFTRSLDIALLNNRIDIAVHSMKDVPTQLPQGITQYAVLERASVKDLLVYKGEMTELEETLGLVNGRWTSINNKTQHSATYKLPYTIATSSTRRKAQWLNRYPHHTVENLRGNVNTRLRKVTDSNWNAAIFAAAGLERIHLRPTTSIELDWMLPAPAQGAIVIVGRGDDDFSFEACNKLNHIETATCTKIEKDFLRTLAGGCTTPIGALAKIGNAHLTFKGNIFNVDGSKRVDIEKVVSVNDSENIGETSAYELLANGGQEIADSIHHAR